MNGIDSSALKPEPSPPTISVMQEAPQFPRKADETSYVRDDGERDSKGYGAPIIPQPFLLSGCGLPSRLLVFMDEDPSHN